MRPERVRGGGVHGAGPEREQGLQQARPPGGPGGAPAWRRLGGLQYVSARLEHARHAGDHGPAQKAALRPSVLEREDRYHKRNGLLCVQDGRHPGRVGEEHGFGPDQRRPEAHAGPGPVHGWLPPVRLPAPGAWRTGSNPRRAGRPWPCPRAARSRLNEPAEDRQRTRRRGPSLSDGPGLLAGTNQEDSESRTESFLGGDLHVAARRRVRFFSSLTHYRIACKRNLIIKK